MDRKHQAQLARSSLLSLGGYTWVRSKDWDDYLQGVLKNEYPDYYQRHPEIGKESDLWKENACIVEALAEYLLHQFGTIIPVDNLFKVYNEDGEGVMPDKLIEAISAVIEPLGFEVEKVIVADAELRSGLGHRDKVLDLDYVGEFEGQPGLCMINIKNGYSHAFFWERMDTSKFFKEQFRMALVVKRKEERGSQSLSAATSVAAFCHMIDNRIGRHGLEDPLHADNSTARLRSEVNALSRYVRDKRNQRSKYFREKVDRRLALILSFLTERESPQVGSRDSTGEDLILEAGQMIRRIVREAKVIH